ncbi:MAG TPA: MFS transporter [Thermoanaerobaculia bacterium]|nr:MFS transporter [Thermoanaerobaculia bacterium]
MTLPRRSILVVVFLTVFIDLVGFGIVIPLLPLYAKTHGPSPAVLGLLMATFSAMQFLFAPVLGRLSDRFGRRPVVLFSLLGTVASYLLFAFAHSIPGLFASRLLAGITGGNIAAAQAIIADVTPPEERARGMGLVGMAFGLGFIFGPAIGGLAVRLGEAGPGLFAAGLSLVAFVWALVRLPETRPEGISPRPATFLPVAALVRTFERPGIGAFLLLSALTTTAFANFEGTFSLFLATTFALPPEKVAGAFVAIGVLGVLVQGGLIRPLVKRFGEVRVLVAGTALVLAGFLALLGARSLATLVPAVGILGVGIGITNPALSGVVSRRTSPAEQGEVLGAFQSMASLGRVVGPFWGASAFLRFGPVGPFGAGLLLEAAALVLCLSRLGRERREGTA